jgi:hypothetical protein
MDGQGGNISGVEKNPSIFLTRRDLAVVLRGTALSNGASLSEADVRRLIDALFAFGGSPGRGPALLNAKLKRIAGKRSSSDPEPGDVELFQRALIAERERRFHKNLTLYPVGHRNFAVVCKVCENALAFCEEFGFDKREGFAKYVKTAMDRIKGVFYVQKLLTVHDATMAAVAVEREAAQDAFPEVTRRVFSTFARELSALGIDAGPYSSPEVYVHFVRTAAFVVASGFDPEDYVARAFRAGAGGGVSVPEPRFMYNDGAARAYVRSLSSDKARARPTTFRSEKEEMYWRSLQSAKGS